MNAMDHWFQERVKMAASYEYSHLGVQNLLGLLALRRDIARKLGSSSEEADISLLKTALDQYDGLMLRILGIPEPPSFEEVVSSIKTEKPRIQVGSTVYKREETGTKIGTVASVSDVGFNQFNVAWQGNPTPVREYGPDLIHF